jgi:outer membrane protein assembly factor BamB
MKTTWLMVTVMMTVTVGATMSATADWRQFRGNDSSGAVAEAGLPGRLEPDRHLAWKADLPGRGLSSPIIVGDRVLVTCASGPRQQRLHVFCFRASDGVKLWERQWMATGRTMCHEKTSVAANTPASDGERVFALFSSNDLVALDLEGNVLWIRGLTFDYPNVSNSLGMSSSLVVEGGTVVAQVENDSQSLALGLDVRTGANRWVLDRPRMANWTSPVVLRNPSLGSGAVVLQSGRGLLAVAPDTGQTLWEYTDGASTVPSSAVGGGMVLVPSHGLTALMPKAAGEAPEMQWRSGTLRPGTSSPVVAGEHVYTINNAGVLNCGQLTDGRRVWQLRLKGPFSASPVVSGHHLYVPNEAGLLQVVDLTEPEGAVVAEWDFGQTLLGTPSISGRALYLRSDRTLWCLAGPAS